jgi:DNA (cytosine-5)-methyltransferase 1
VTAWYNEIDPYAAAWLRNLIAAGHIAPGDVDERSIVDVQPDDLKGYTQCHFFAGIGGWSYAARLAGWPDDRVLWTGSCPCQPFSSSGKRGGVSDPRHLWPIWFALIEQLRPAFIAGEQVATKAGLSWFDGVQADLASANYASQGVSLSAAGFGAPHIRERLYWLADADRDRLERLAEPDKRAPHELTPSRRNYANGCGSSFWSSARPLEGADGTRRILEPGIEPLADGIPARVGKLRAYGNAIVPQVGAEVIGAYLETERAAA